MPKLLSARPASDEVEAYKVHKLANSRHAPGDWIMRAQMIVRSWTGLRCAPVALRTSYVAIHKPSGSALRGSTLKA